MENSSVSGLEVKRSYQLPNVKNPNCLQNEQLTSSSSSPKVKDNSIGEIEMKIEENADQSPMALLPVEIRLMIFKNLDFKSLKNARLVNQSWNIEATPILSDCSQINLNDFFEMCKNIKGTFPENITPGLIKHIHAPYKSKVNLRWTYLREFCKEYSNEIIGIAADGDGYDYRDVVQHLGNVLIKCPKLQSLSLSALLHKDVGEKKSRHLRKVIFSKPLLSLKFIELDFDLQWEIARCEHFLDNIFKAAENLEQLKISGPFDCFYPDLSNNKKLKILQITSDWTNEWEIVDIPEINTMIEQVSSSLETLVFLQAGCLDSLALYSRSSEVDVIQDEPGFSFPSNMSQLKVFINRDFFTFPMDSCISLLLNCENLQTLQLTPYFHPNIKITEEFFKGVTPHLKLENLKIAEIETESILETICKIFPNLKQIDFAVGKVRISNGVTIQLERFIINCLEICCSNTKLVDITVRMQLYSVSSITEILLDCGKLFAGGRTLTFVNRHEYNVPELPIDVKDIEIEKFQNSLLLTRGLKIFLLKNFIMKAAATMKIAEFIMINNLPVRFIN